MCVMVTLTGCHRAGQEHTCRFWGVVYCNSLIGIVDTLAKIGGGMGVRMNTEVQDKGE